MPDERARSTPTRMSLRVALLDRIRGLRAWPAYQELLRSQWLTPPAIEATRDQKLRRLLRGAANIPAYREGLAPWVERLDQLDPRRVLSELPILTRSEVRRNETAMRNPDPQSWRRARAKATGGSTGEPLRYFISASAHSAQWANIWRSWSVAGYTPGSPIGIVAGRSLLAGEGAQRWVYAELQNWTTLDAFSMTEAAVDRFVHALRAKNVRRLYGYASALDGLARFVEAAKLRVEIDAVFTTAEQLLPTTRARIERAFRTTVYDSYGANDGGVFAFECERRDGLHIGAERCLLEIVRSDGSPAPPGEVGRVVATDLENLTFPFLRYEVGDLAALEPDPCACGRGLPRIRELSGRISDVMVLPDGARVHGELFSHYFRSQASVARYQAIQTSADSVELRVSASTALASGDEARIRDEVAALLPGLHVSLVTTDEFRRTPSGKVPLVIPFVGE